MDSYNSAMLACKNAIVTFWNALFYKNNNKLTSYVTVLFYPYSTLALYGNKAYFVPLIHPRKVQYILVTPVSLINCLLKLPSFLSTYSSN